MRAASQTTTADRRLSSTHCRRSLRIQTGAGSEGITDAQPVFKWRLVPGDGRPTSNGARRWYGRCPTCPAQRPHARQDSVPSEIRIPRAPLTKNQYSSAAVEPRIFDSVFKPITFRLAENLIAQSNCSPDGTGLGKPKRSRNFFR